MFSRLLIYFLKKPQVVAVIREITQPSPKLEGMTPETLRAVQAIVFGTSE
ncbi:hypothetical protein PMCN03_0344 [Pasteurella multocida subsp. multocida str. HB03]|nr:hypothetical protein NT08PM_1317 [Pasteurella multocida subsp. multocida str. 3480]AHE63810.1 hypothetical protein PMCN03_0344 [Pasteurella multocida subsp. multocida str. HB03]EJZ77346.1 hypothetical protein X73_02044 [Pasteurella multocida subsp. gallicida X73]